ncbi:MAG: DNA-directed RNA polymerase subunit H [Candidatus Heimdallarchaeota archaeon]|nr:MAG: DNA-directed RNA polymerase subunit H [Candidatus Heimdallarchaeota archaeon]
MSTEAEILTKNLLRGIKSILKRREYNVVNEERFEHYIDLICELEKDTTQEMYASISLEEKVGVSVLRDYVKRFEQRKEEKGEENVKGLLVASNRFTHYARREAKEQDIWIITSKDPRFDIFTHDLVPEHIICPEEELKELLEKYNIKRRHLPKIFASDPAVKAVGAKPGEVVKIFRHSDVAGESIAYRLVVRRES